MPGAHLCLGFINVPSSKLHVQNSIDLNLLLWKCLHFIFATSGETIETFSQATNSTKCVTLKFNDVNSWSISKGGNTYKLNGSHQLFPGQEEMRTLTQQPEQHLPFISAPTGAGPTQTPLDKADESASK